ncbi:hypothetical protein A6S26_11170 [Nostoc sp. ATCC 43529]|nr:hypothetical protein A6S26_11170 [Nostoc sp. ATCC 43529]
MLKPNPKDLQKDVIDLLEDVKNLMNRASKVLDADGVSNKYTQFEPQVNDEMNKVKNLELRMAIVAPMKAGKSTIVNATVGQEILPSRNSAMTTLPTEVIFDAEVTEPVLILNDQIVAVFQKTLLLLKDKINELGIEEVKKRISQYPHLTQIPQKIKESLNLSIPGKIQGREKIIETLAWLNDIVRLCSILVPHAEPLMALDDIPRIKTPFWRLQKNIKTAKFGHLVIVDTPGPNEAGENLKLKGVVEEQLTKSSIVLIVLDFTQLKTEAAEKVKQDVHKVIEIRGKENLYALINKVDQRREGDMTTNEVQKFVAAEFGIGDNSNTNRVFEISAIKAFTSANFLRELELNRGIKLAAMHTVNALAKEALGTRWEEKLKKATTEELKEEAEYLWKESGCDNFMDQAINALMAEAAPRCMASALKVTSGLIGQLRSDIEVRKKAINQEGGELKKEIEAFEKDLQELEAFNQHLQEVHKIKDDLFKQLNKQIEDIKDKAKTSIKKIFFAEAGANKNLFDNFVDKMRSLISLNITINDEIEFEREEAAKYFVEQAIFATKQDVDPLLEKELKKVETSIENKRRDLINSLRQKTKPIIQRARQRLKALDLPDLTIELLLPMPTFDSGNIEMTTDVMRQSRTIDGGYDTEVIKKRKFTHWFWLVPKEEIIRVKRPDVREDYYTVSRQEIVEKSNAYIEENIQSLKQGIVKYIDEDFKQEIEIFFKEIESQLSNIREQLKSAQQAQKLEAKEREKLLAEFNSLLPEASKKSDKIGTYLKYTEQMMS